jgi:hypothetical protein
MLWAMVSTHNRTWCRDEVVSVIEIEKKNQNEFVKLVREKETRSQHLVTLDDAYYHLLTQGKITKEDLIRKSFQFLLERESKESILRSFNLQMIKRYFPEYEEEMSSSMAKG